MNREAISINLNNLENKAKSLKKSIKLHIDEKTKKKCFKTASSLFLKISCFNQLVCLTNRPVVPTAQVKTCTVYIVMK